MKKKLEICSYSVESAVLAEQYGADRIELCDNYSEGGTTPSYGAVKYAIDKLGIPTNVMVRPRGGDFLYSDVDYEIMKMEVKQMREMGAHGVVIGFLQANGDIDVERTKEIRDLAGPMEVTFHRAFDMCRAPLQALEQLIEIGVTRILSSGTRVNVVAGMDFLAQMVEQAGDRIIIMPGCGLSPDNIEALLQKTNAIEVHSASKTFEPSKMEYFNPHVSMGGVANVDEYKTVSLHEGKVRAMVEVLKRYS